MMGEFCAKWHKISLGLILYKEVLLWGQNSHWLSAFSHQLALISEKNFLGIFSNWIKISGHQNHHLVTFLTKIFAPIISKTHLKCWMVFFYIKLGWHLSFIFIFKNWTCSLYSTILFLRTNTNKNNWCLKSWSHVRGVIWSSIRFFADWEGQLWIFWGERFHFWMRLGSLSVELPFDEAELRLDDECLFGLEDVCAHPVFDE